MARNSTLLATSCHPSHVIHNLPVGEFIRTKRNCSSHDVFLKQQREVSERLLKREYPKWTIDRAIAKTIDIPRSKLLQPKNKK